MTRLGLTTSLEILIGDWLHRRDLKLVVAESCTGGLIGHLITNVPGSSAYYLGSITAYAYSVKERILGVHPETLLAHGAVSRATVLEMARGVRQSLGGESTLDKVIGLSVSGIAGPGGATPDKPVGLVWIGISAPEGDFAWHFIGHGDRRENKAFSAEMALQLLLEVLQGQPRPE